MSSAATIDWTMDSARSYLRSLSEYADEWAGIPIPIEGEKLIIAKGYKFAGCFSDPKGEPDDFTVVNQWYSRSKRGQVVIMRESDGRTTQAFLPTDSNHAAGMQLRTLGVCCAWDIDTEIKAFESLSRHVNNHKLKQYMLTGGFIETSPRSGIKYIFRRLRPTLALSVQTGVVRVLAALCLHPIGYYAGTWAGGMCPTDDVLSHLLLMRSDEHFLWRKANQHPPWIPEAGL